MEDNTHLPARCKKVKSKVSLSKTILFIFLVSMVVFSIFFYLSSCSSKIKGEFAWNFSLDTSKISIYNSSTGIYDNVSLSESDDNFYVERVEIYLSSVKTLTTKTEMLQYICYGKPLSDYVGINTLKITIMYEPNGSIPNFYSLRDINRIYDCPNEYVLSYVCIKIKSIMDSKFEINYYYFFQDDSNISTKMDVVSYLKFIKLEFDNRTYSQWYNWKFNNGTMPSKYPYMVQLYMKNYITYLSPFDNQYYEFWW